MGRMPFRIKATLAILGLMVLLTLVLPLVLPIRPPAGTQPAAALADPDSRFIEVDGIRVHAKIRGPQPGTSDMAFVLLHDFGGSTYSWHAIMDRLAELGTGGAFDRPAFGLTERPAPGSWSGESPYSPAAQVRLTVDLMTTLGIDRAVLIGHSVGATVALETAAAHPERVRGLVLADAAVYQRSGSPSWARWLLATPQLNRLGPVIMRQLAGPAGEEVIRNGWADPDKVPDASIAEYRKGLQVDGWDVALWQYTRASRPTTVLNQLPSMSVPSLVLTGALDAVVPPADSERLAATLPAAEFLSLPDCGHVPQEECPTAFLAALATWLQVAPF